MRTSVLDKFPNSDLSVSVIWIRMLPGDTKEAATTSAGLISDPRARHFHDPGQLLGEAIANGLEWKGQTAWDIYLFYDKDGRWEDTPPAPVDFMHQLRWEPTHFRTGDDLVKGLSEAMQKMLLRATG